MATGIAVCVIVAGFILQVKVRADAVKRRAARTLLCVSIAAVGAYAVYLTVAQYLLWRGDEGLGKFLLPPYQPLSYVVGYQFIRFDLFYAISLAVALLLLAAATYADRKAGHRFFRPGEPYLMALAIFLLGNPAWHYAWLWYLAAMLLISLILLLSYHVIGFGNLTNLLDSRNQSRRISLYYLWLPVALSVIIMNVV